MSKFTLQALADPEKAKARIFEALETVNGNRQAAARLLGVKHRALMHRIQKLGILEQIQAKWPRPGMRCFAHPMTVQPDPPPKAPEKTELCGAVYIDLEDL